MNLVVCRRGCILKRSNELVSRVIIGVIVTLSRVILITTRHTKLHGPLSRVYDVEVHGPGWGKGVAPNGFRSGCPWPGI